MNALKEKRGESKRVIMDQTVRERHKIVLLCAANRERIRKKIIYKIIKKISRLRSKPETFR